LKDRRTAFKNLQTQIKSEEANLEKIQQERTHCELIIQEQSENIDATESEVKDLLDANNEYQLALKTTERASLIAQSAQEKVETALNDFSVKARVYENEPLFMYLWKRGYGTESYSTNAIIRSLDNWVSRLCGFDQARVDYWNLKELPKRLQEHAKHVQKLSEQSIRDLAELETRLLKGTPYQDAVNALDAEQNRRDRIDQTFEDAESKLNKLLKDEISFANGTDPQMKACLDLIAQTLGRQDVNNLRMESLRTENYEDDQLIEQLINLKEIHEELEDLTITLQKSQTAQTRKLSDIEELRRNFKRQRFDDYQSGFSNDRLVKTAIRGLVEGVITGTDVWSTLERNRRHRPIGHNKRRGPRYTRTIGRSNQRRSSSRGGFRTGGGF